MGIFQQFPYSNFHEMNLDQIIKIMREMQDEWAATKTEWTSYKEFIDNYFDTLDVSDEVMQAMRTFAGDGTLNEILDDPIAAAVAAWLAEHITQPTTPVVDTSLSVAGAAADAKVTGDEINGVKNNLWDYINGVNKTYTISVTGSNFFPMLILKGVKYSFVNRTSGVCAVNYRKSDGTSEPIITQLNPNVPIYFIPNSDEYIGIASYCNGTGTIEITNYFSSMKELENISSSINDGILPIGKLIPNKYITTNGTEANDANWSATDFIKFGSLCKVLRVTAPASSGGNYNAFYDATKAFISNFPVRNGINNITIPDNAVYIRLSNTTSNLQQTTIENIIGYLNRVVEELHPESTTSIYDWNVDESMIVNAGANYGYHSGGQSNIEKRFSLLVTTDPHGDATAMKRAVDYLNDMPCFDCGCCLGDLQADTFNDNDGTWYTDAIKDTNKPWLTLVGNHDVGIGNSIASTGNQEQVYEKFIEPNLQYAGVTPDGKSYYYKDFTTYKIRLICLNPYDVDNNDTSGNEYVVPRYTEYYSQAQINWFVSLLTSTPADYHVMILTHNAPKAATKDTSVNFNNKTYAFSPESSQQGIVADIVDAWQRGTSLSHTYPCSNPNLNSVTVTADFTSRGVGVLICFLTGHVHVDAIGHITSFANQNVFVFASTNAGTWQNNWSDLPRADGTKAEDCITAISVDTTNRDIYINRIGSSVSKWFTVREPSIISY